MQSTEYLSHAALSSPRPSKANTKTPNVLLTVNVIMIFQWINYSIVCQAIDIIGIAANIINIICFVKQGFIDPVNVSFLGLTIADLGCLATLTWTNICLNPAFMAADLPFVSVELQHLTTGMLHITFTHVTSWMTALITLERCLCIIAPLKIKNIITPRRVSVVIVCVFTILMASIAPVYVVDTLAMKWIPERNRTLLGLVRIENREEIEKVSSAISNMFIPFSAFVVVIICTVTLVTQLRRNTQWRKTSATSKQIDNISNRNRKVSRMVVIISTFFITCFIPVRILFIVISMVPEFSVHGEYRPLLIVIGGIGVVLESLNSSVNIVFYYHMSSNYRTVFRQLFKIGN